MFSENKAPLPVCQHFLDHKVSNSSMPFLDSANNITRININQSINVSRIIRQTAKTITNKTQKMYDPIVEFGNEAITIIVAADGIYALKLFRLFSSDGLCLYRAKPKLRIVADSILSRSNIHIHKCGSPYVSTNLLSNRNVSNCDLNNYKLLNYNQRMKISLFIQTSVSRKFTRFTLENA